MPVVGRVALRPDAPRSARRATLKKRHRGQSWL